MKLNKYSVNSGKINMEIDELMLNNNIINQIKEPEFRLYGWSPKCISLGRNQKKIHTSCNIDIVRRLTGGRALLHDDEITYSYITPISIIDNGNNIIESYKYISGILIKFFKTMGIDLDFGENKKISTHFDYCMLISTGADVCYKNKKLIGSAQYRKNGYILQHGSILYNYNKELLEHLFNEEVKGITCIKDIIPNLSKEKLIKNLENYIINL